MFIPNTYEMYWNSSADDFIRRMKKESDRFWKNRDEKLARTGLSRDGAMTLASIVYEETKRKDEMPVVAGGLYQPAEARYAAAGRSDG